MEKNLIYLGEFQGEEIYINLKKGDLTGWSLMRLRPETEENLRRYARDVEITDYYSIDPAVLPYIDREAFSDDMENDWLDRHDSQGEYHIDGEIYYLGFGLRTDIFNFFSEHKIKTYSDFVSLFKEVNLTEEQFNELLSIMELYKKDEKKGYDKFMKFQGSVSEFPHKTDEYKESLKH